MSTSKELVELNELYGKIQLDEWFWNKKNKENKNTNKDQEKNDKNNQKDKSNNLNDSTPKDDKDDKDDKEEIKGPNINNNKSNKTEKKKLSNIPPSEGNAVINGKKINPDFGKETDINKQNAAKKQKEASDDEKGANEWGPGGQPSASKQIDAYKKGRPSPASFKTNQRQTRELIKKQSKEVYPSVTKQDLNQFNRTKKYTADDGSQVERSTVFTKHYKTGKPLGVMTGSQRKAYDKAAAAYKAQPTPTPKPEIKPEKSVPAVETKPDTYKTKIGAFLNNKKKGDVKDKSRHTKVTSVMDMMDSYDAYDLVLDYIMESKQASSIEEANYIMFEMDQNTIHEIVQAQKKSLDEGLKTAIGIGLLATPYLMKKFGKKPVDKMIKDKRKTSTIGGENRKDKIEKATGVDLDNW